MTDEEKYETLIEILITGENPKLFEFNPVNFVEELYRGYIENRERNICESECPSPSTIPLMLNIDDALYIGFSKHQNELTSMIAIRRVDNKDAIINVLQNEEAEEVYKKLINWDNQFN